MAGDHETTAPFFAGASELKLQAPPSVMIASHCNPTLLAPATGGAGGSFHGFGIGNLIFVDKTMYMDGTAGLRHGDFTALLRSVRALPR